MRLIKKNIFAFWHSNRIQNWRSFQTVSSNLSQSVVIQGKEYEVDKLTNVTPRIINKIGHNLHLITNHPLNLLSRRIQDFFYKRHTKPSGNPIFSVYDNFNPIVTTKQNFDSLLVPPDHISRSPKDTYYINSQYLLRAHTSAHESDLIRSGLDAFLVVGDVYRRDDIDSTHYPVFHQVEGARLFSHDELFKNVKGSSECISLFEKTGDRTELKQSSHTLETAKMLEHELKSVLENLAVKLFGKNVEFRWVDAYFPFTHPSWELEIKIGDVWTEMLGCGLLEQDILNEAGAVNKVGYAFGLGLERWAMKLYNINDIRVFWSEDTGFLSQFQTDDIHKNIKYKPISVYPQCKCDLSFWLPSNELIKEKEFVPYDEKDFFEIIRDVAGNLVEQVNLIDDFIHPKTGRNSKCYRIIYRSVDKTLTLEEVNVIHKNISDLASKQFGVEIR